MDKDVIKEHLFWRWLARGIAALVLLITALSGPRVFELDKTVGDVIKIGAIAHRGIEKATKRWTPTADHLSEGLPRHRVRMVPALSVISVNARKPRASCAVIFSKLKASS